MHIPSTGEGDSISVPTVATDSVLISYDDLRIVNGKLVELDYTKQINEQQSIIINNNKLMLESCYQCLKDNQIKIKKIKRQRNIFVGTTIGALVSGLLIGLLN